MGLFVHTVIACKFCTYIITKDSAITPVHLDVNSYELYHLYRDHGAYQCRSER